MVSGGHFRHRQKYTPIRQVRPIDQNWFLCKKRCGSLTFFTQCAIMQLLWINSSVGQSSRLITGGSGVRVPVDPETPRHDVPGRFFKEATV